MKDAPNIIRLELKYCERCGGLWLRLIGSDAVFCGSCSRDLVLWSRARDGAQVSELPAVPSHEKPFWAEGGNA